MKIIVTLFQVVFLSLLTRGALSQCTTRQRRVWRDTSCQDKLNYLQAVEDLKALPSDNAYGVPSFDDFVRVHYQNRASAHGTDAFLPWHRWYIYKFEEALQIVSGNSCLMLPIWDWEYDAEIGEMSATVLEVDTFGSSSGVLPNGRFRGCVDEGIVDYRGTWASTVWTGGCLERSFNTNYQFATESQLLAIIADSDQFSNFRPALEGYPHAAPHNFIGS